MTGRVAISEVRRFIVDCMTAVGTPQNHAAAMADLLVEADKRGHFSHGLNRLEMYVRDLKSKTCDGNAVPSILKDSPATAWVDGNNGLGAVVGNFCMNLAIKKAKDCGVGWVVAKGSNHYGIASWYSMQAIKNDMLGMSFSNTSPLLCPTRSKKAALGTNPLTLGAPAKNGDSFLLDMATTAVAVGKIEVQIRKNEPIPAGWAQDKEGNITTDAEVAFKSSSLMPLGGSEQTSGYKGYGLALLVETFCGILSGSHFGPNIRKWMDPTGSPADLGQCFIAVNPLCFAPGFEGRMSELIDSLRGLPPVDPNKPVLVPGDPERKNIEKVNQEGGVLYHPNQLKSSEELAKSLGVKPMHVQ